MKQENILFLEPIFKERIWGGQALRDIFGYEIPEGNIGECWGISAHQNGDCLVQNGQYEGKRLSELWKEAPHLFGNPTEEQFPLLVKILDASADLSVQVHPDDAYAHQFESGELGKTECWYVLDCADDAEIVIGHNATSKEEAATMIEAGNWDQFLRRIKIKPGDFFYIPAGTIHGICKNTLILEVQQSSDTTYRLYDYERLDDAGNKRDLHIEKSLDVMTVPHEDVIFDGKSFTSETACTRTYVDNAFFSVKKCEIKGDFTLNQEKDYALVSIINGMGEVEGTKIGKGDHFIVPATCEEVRFTGEMEFMVATP